MVSALTVALSRMNLNEPFLGTEAIAAGLVTRRTLRSRYVKMHRNVYVPTGFDITPVAKATGAWLFSGRSATLAGVSAAAALGTRWLDARLPAELVRTEACSNGIVAHRVVLPDDEVMIARGMPATTPARTAFDLGRRRPQLANAVIGVDALANATGVTPADIAAIAARHPGARGSVQLRQVLDLMDGGAESPQETRTRLVLLESGFPRPQTQIDVYDEGGYSFARVDMGWEAHRVGIEYDGEQHWTDPRRRAHDIDKNVELAEMGWRIVHVGADMLRNRPWVLVHRTCDALRANGCTWVDECEIVPRYSWIRAR